MKKSKRKSKKIESFKGTKPVLIFSGIFIAVFAVSMGLYFLSDKNPASNNSEVVNSSPSNAVEINSSPLGTSPVLSSTPVPASASQPVANDKQANNTVSDKDQQNTQQSSQDKVNWKQKVDSLPSEGFKKEELDSSKQYVQGVVSNLNQIISFSSTSDIIPKPGIQESSSSDDTAKYQDLSTKIDIDKAVYHMIKISNLLGSKEKVFDEYLLTLQLDLDVSEIASDKASYEKKKNEKLRGIDQNSLITADGITQKMMESIQKQNEQNRNSITNPNQETNKGLPGISNPSNNLPGIQVPNVPDPEAEIRKKLGH
jgi:hypothetical protein